MTRYIAAIDQGTTSTRLILFDAAGNTVAVGQKEHEQIFPEPGWVEHDAAEIWRNTLEVAAEAFAAANASAVDVAAIGITNQRETTLLWDRKTGEPLHNALVWQDTRVGNLVKQFAADGGQDRFRAKTGLPLTSYFSGLKLKWLLDNVAGARQKAEAGDLAFGTIDSWLIWKLTGGPDGGRHITDVTNASRTQLMDLELLELRPISISRDGYSRLCAARNSSIEHQLRRGDSCATCRYSDCRRIGRSAGSALSVRPASNQARPRTPMEPAASYCSIPAPSRCNRAPAC